MYRSCFSRLWMSRMTEFETPSVLIIESAFRCVALRRSRCVASEPMMVRPDSMMSSTCAVDRRSDSPSSASTSMATALEADAAERRRKSCSRSSAELRTRSTLVRSRARNRLFIISAVGTRYIPTSDTHRSSVRPTHVSWRRSSILRRHSARFSGRSAATRPSSVASCRSSSARPIAQSLASACWRSTRCSWSSISYLSRDARGRSSAIDVILWLSARRRCARRWGR
mmetsp:Transcript_14616/g.58393  ORF Transcript_14616/g.58393 Transcript_14616/m.58393 type:complete len:227 (+) Transcript_14616:298-978(+)